CRQTVRLRLGKLSLVQRRAGYTEPAQTDRLAAAHRIRMKVVEALLRGLSVGTVTVGIAVELPLAGGVEELQVETLSRVRELHLFGVVETPARGERHYRLGAEHDPA